LKVNGVKLEFAERATGKVLKDEKRDIKI